MRNQSNVRAVDFRPLEFTIGLEGHRTFVVREKLERSGGVFVDLSSAILFVRRECETRGVPPAVKFDQTVACIRAAG